MTTDEIVDDPINLVAGVIYEGLRNNAHRTRYGQARAIAYEMLISGAAKKPTDAPIEFAVASRGRDGYASELEELTAAFDLARTQNDDAESERLILAIVAWLDHSRANWNDTMLPLLRAVMREPPPARLVADPGLLSDRPGSWG